MSKDNEYKKVEKASMIINNILSKNNIKMHSSYYYKLGSFFEKSGNTKKALEQFQKAIKINPRNPMYLLRFAKMLSMEKKDKEALRYTKKALIIDPRYVPAICFKGITEGKSGQYKRALKTFKSKNIRHCKSSNKCASLSYNIGLTYQLLNNYRMALIFYNRALKYNPNDSKILGMKGVCLVKLGKGIKALKYFKKEANIRPKDLSPILSIGFILLYHDKLSEARKWAAKSLKLAPNDIGALELNAAISYESNRYKETLKYIDKAIKLNRNDDRLLTIKGKTLYRLKQLKKAEHFFKKALAVNPNNYSSLINYTALLINKNKYSKGMQILNRALKVNPQSIRGLYYKGFILLQQKKYRHGIAILNKYVTKVKWDAGAYYNLACAYALTKRLNKSLKMLRKAIKLNKKYKIDAQKDKDFINIRKNKAFKKLIP